MQHALFIKQTNVIERSDAFVLDLSRFIENVDTI